MTSVADRVLAQIRDDIGTTRPKQRKPTVPPRHEIPTLKGELWNPIEGYSHYWVSNYGRILSFRRSRHIPRILSQTRIERYGHPYARVSLYDNRSLYVHTLVAKAFCSQPTGDHVVSFKDGNTLNTHAENLEWINRTESRKRHPQLQESH